jgi:hypothetical protein
MLHTLREGLKSGLKTTWILGKVIFPVTFIVSLLSFTPVIDWIVYLYEPLMKWIGLSGEAAIPFVLANVLNIYAGIGAVLTLDLTVKEVFILAMMMSFSHNLLIETTVSSKVGVPAWAVVTVRLGLAVGTAFLIHHIWQGGGEPAQYGFFEATGEQNITGIIPIVMYGVSKAIMGILQLAIVVIPLMVFIQWMKDTKFLLVFTRWMTPLTKVLGLSPNTATTLGAGVIFGLAFGAGVIIQAIKEDNIKKKDLYLLFIFLVACHAVIEDTLIFIPLGIPVWPLLVLRLIIAFVLTGVIAYVWNRVEKKQENYREGAHNEV